MSLIADNPSCLTDFSSTIRAEIEREVSRLIKEVKGHRHVIDGIECSPHSPVIPECIELGYIVNSHHGQALYSTGDRICGVVVDVDTRHYPRSISVVTRDVVFYGEEWNEDGDNWEDVDEMIDIRKTATW